jgi:glycosyltransferase involved in cell wall biosynthesis
VRIAFHAPLKAPTHPSPSGDRRMARQLIAALQHAGHDVEVASNLRSFEGRGLAEHQTAIRMSAETEAENIIEQIRSIARAERPDVWFTYHLYYKAPDWIGPTVSASLGLAYVVAEASYAPKRANGPWAAGHEAVATALRAADAVLALTRRDMPCIQPLLNDHAKQFYLPPFLDIASDCASGSEKGIRDNLRNSFAKRHGLDIDKHWLLTVAMMRAGDKLNSYRLLARAAATLPGDDWQLVIVGDGEARAEVADAFSSLSLASQGGHIAWMGELPDSALPGIYAACDVFVWPAINEAYGMALLEAQAAGLPLVVGNEGGVPDVMRDGITGLLIDSSNPEEFATAVRGLLNNAIQRKRLGSQGRTFVRQERALPQASTIVNEAVMHAYETRRQDSSRAS